MSTDQAGTTDDSSDFVAPPVPELTAPYRTDDRLALQTGARRVPASNKITGRGTAAFRDTRSG